MPLYDFICSSSHEFETLAAFGEAKACPECGADSKRQFPKRNLVVWGEGAALVDVYDKDHDEMSGELDGA